MMEFPGIGKRDTGPCRAGAVAVSCVLLFAGCATQKGLESSVRRSIERTAESTSSITTHTVADSSATVPAELPESPVLLNAESVLHLATDYGRELQNRRESLEKASISLFGVQRDFSFGYSGTLDFVLEEGEERSSETASADLDVSRVLPTGGDLSAGASARMTSTDEDGTEDGEGESGDAVYTSAFNVRIDQPLLAGAGYRVRYEPLIQARRNFVYALRDFSLQRQDLAIDVLRSYYNLVSSGQGLENIRKNVERFQFLRERSEALFRVDRAPAIDVLRSQQEELSAINRRTEAEESYLINVGRFLIQLGLPSTLEADVADDIPQMRKVAFAEDEAVTLALDLRLDLQTVRERVEDAERKLRNAKNAMLPQADAFGEAVWTGEESESLDASEYASVYRAGLAVELPLDKRDERDAIRNAAIDLEQAGRELAEREDSIVLEVRESFSQLRTQATAVEIQEKNIEIAEKRARNAFLQFRNGVLSNRDVIEAENELLQARNAYVQALADYEIQRVRLLRNIGMLDVAADGRLIELEAPR